MPGEGNKLFANGTTTSWFKDFDYIGPERLTNQDTAYKYSVKSKVTISGSLGGFTTGNWVVGARAGFLVGTETLNYPLDSTYHATGIGGQPFRIGPSHFDREETGPTVMQFNGNVLSIVASASVGNAISLDDDTAPNGTATAESGENICTVDELALNATVIPPQPPPNPGED